MDLETQLNDLRVARDVIQQRGHLKIYLTTPRPPTRKDPNGSASGYVESYLLDGQFCSRGALQLAKCLRTGSELLATVDNSLGNLQDDLLTSNLYEVIPSKFKSDTRTKGNCVADFNNHPSTTTEDVVEVFDMTIEALENEILSKQRVNLQVSGAVNPQEDLLRP